MSVATRRARARLLATAALAAVACGRGTPERAPAASRAPDATAATAVRGWSADSALERFRAGLEPTDTLRFGAPTRDALVSEVVEALEHADTARLVRLHLSRAEFAYLVYPGSRFTRAPYRQPPAVTWLLVTERSSSGLARLLQRRGGRKLGVVGYACAASPDTVGGARYWGNCRVQLRTPEGSTATELLFTSIVERGGRFKIGSYGNSF